MLKRIKYEANLVVSLDGIHSVSREKGFEESVPSHIADSLCSDGRAKELTAKVSYETKELTDEEKAKLEAKAEARDAKKKAKADAKAAAKAAKNKKS